MNLDVNRIQKNTTITRSQEWHNQRLDGILYIHHAIHVAQCHIHDFVYKKSNKHV